MNFIPLIVLSDSSFLVCKRGYLCLYNLSTDQYVNLSRLPLSFMKMVFSYFKLTARLLRLINVVCCQLNENEVIIAFDGAVYNLYINERKLEYLYSLDKGRRPLGFENVPENSFIKEGIYYGDYYGNSEKREINIYRIDKKNKIKEIVYTFAKGEINHVHAIKFDDYNKTLWIFTGDFGDAAAIWKVSESFKRVELVLSGNQNYRSCVVTCNNGELIYATDTPFKQNTLRRLFFENECWQSGEIEKINGSVIYGIRVTDKFVFSSTVEPNGYYTNRLNALLTRKRGDGIYDNYIYLYVYDYSNKSLKIMYKQEKDSWPYTSFQFGAFMFPYSINQDSSQLPVFHVATKKNDLKTVILPI